MSTRSMIGMYDSKNAMPITAIYCHWDGYPEHNGKLLVRHYSSDKRVETLLALGDLSSLGPEIGHKGAEINPLNPQQCVAYGRDRNEEDVEAQQYSSLLDMKSQRSDCEYFYIWQSDCWACYDSSLKLVDLYKILEDENDVA